VVERHILSANPSVIAQDDLVNVGRLHETMRALRLDAIVCRGGVNVAYLSGIATPGTLGRHLDLTETDRPTFVIWPSQGGAMVVISKIASEVAGASGRIPRLRTYPDYVAAPEAALAEVLRELGLGSARVGFDRAWFSARRWADLQTLVPELETVDCTVELDAVRAVKTRGEVKRLREAALLLDRALSDVFHDVAAGQTERDVHIRITARALELGADSIHGILQSSSNHVLYGGESDLRLVEGDLVRTDYVAYLRGYAANVSRILHIGRPSDAVKRKYAAYLDIYRAAVDLLRPGATGGEIHRSIGEMFKRGGWPPGPAISGHGVGVWFHQQRPLLVVGSRDLLEAGMVIALEPISGHWHLQDEYLITDQGPQRISDLFDLDGLPWAV